MVLPVIDQQRALYEDSTHSSHTPRTYYTLWRDIPPASDRQYRGELFVSGNFYQIICVPIFGSYAFPQEVRDPEGESKRTTVSTVAEIFSNIIAEHIPPENP